MGLVGGCVESELDYLHISGKENKITSVALKKNGLMCAHHGPSLYRRIGDEFSMDICPSLCLEGDEPILGVGRI